MLGEALQRKAAADSIPETTTAVFPTDYEILTSILNQYQKQLNDASKSTEEAIDKLRKNLRSAEDASIGIMAQRKLIETLSRDMAQTPARKA